MATPTVSEASPAKRATNLEMSARADFLLTYAAENGPVTVRQLFYAATVDGVPGIDKTEAGYKKVQRQVLELRRNGSMPYSVIADGTRWMRKPLSHSDIESALAGAVQLYRRDLWSRSEVRVEVWLEKDALAGVIFQVTSEFDVPLMVTRGFSSETFAHDAVQALRGSDRGLVVLSLYDFDRSGKDAEASLHEKVDRFAREFGVSIEFRSLGLNEHQVRTWNLPTRPPKRGTLADQRWPHAFAAELDAIQPDRLRRMVADAIEEYLPAAEFAKLKQIEEHERAQWLEVFGRH